MVHKESNDNNLTKVILYHEIKQDKVDHTLTNGLHLDKPSDKEDSPIEQTNQLLNSLMPEDIKDKGLNRTRVLYLYYARDGVITDIQDGKQTSIEDFDLGEDQALLEVNAPLEQCYISDLDLFDSVKSLVEKNQIDVARSKAEEYWQSIIPLKDYGETVGRPEVIVTTDIEPSDITLKRESDTS